MLLLAFQWLRRKCRSKCAMAWQWGERRGEEEGRLARVARMTDIRAALTFQGSELEMSLSV